MSDPRLLAALLVLLVGKEKASEVVREVDEPYLSLAKGLLDVPITLRGVVVSGSGEGKYFLSLEGYKRQIYEKLGFEPYPGTLNVLLDDESAERKVLLALRKPIVIEGFVEDGRRYGDVLAYPVKIVDVWPAALIIPTRTHHPPSIAEIIAPVNLREKLGLKNGDTVIIKVY